MGRKKNKHTLEAVFEKQSDTMEEIKPTSFFEMYRYATRLDKVLLGVGIFFATAAGVVQPLNPLLFGTVTGDIIKYAYYRLYPSKSQEAEEELLDNIRYFAIMNSLIGFCMMVFNYISTTTFNYAAMRQIFKIRSMYLKKVLNQDVAWYDVHQTGDFASRMSDDLSKLEDGLGEKVPMFYNLSVVFVGSMAVALYKGWELALICFTPFPATMVVMLTIGWLTTKLSKKELDAYAAAGSIAEEVLTSIRTVVAFGGQQKEEERYNTHLIEAKKNNIKRMIFTAITWGFLWFVIFSSYALSFWYGVKLVLKGHGDPNWTYTPGNMVTVFFSVMVGFMSFGTSSPYVEAFAISKAAAGKVFSVIDNVPVINVSKGRGDKIKDVKGNLTFRDVNFHYPSRKDTPVLQKLNLDIKSGDIVALVGSSGCGKSTVIQLIQRFYDPVVGEIEIDGKNLKDLDLVWLRSIIGVVGQEPILFDTTILENIKYGHQNASEDEVIRAAIKANAHKFIMSLPNGYNTLVGERGAQLSGGQKQRLAIARALIRNPRILLLDEATSALDNTSEARVQAALDLASKECTTIIVAHRLSTIRGANRIVVLANGKVVEQGTHNELMSKKKAYYKLVMAQVGNDDIISTIHKKKLVEIEDEEDVPIDTPNKYLKSEDEDTTQKDISLGSVLKMNAPEWPQILIASLSSVIVGCAMPLFAVLFGNIIGVLSNKDENYVHDETNKFCLYLVLGGLILMISTFVQFTMFGIAGERMTERIRKMMFKSILSQEIGFFDRNDNGVGALCSKLSTDAASVQGATGQRIASIVQSLSTLLISVGLSMYYEWKLGLVAMSFTPVILVAMFFERRNTMGMTDARGKSLQNSTKIAVECITNIRTVTSLGLEETFHNIYTSELLPYYKRSLRSVHWRGMVFGLSRGIMFVAYSTCIFYGGYLIIDGLDYDKVFKVSQALILGTTSIANSLAFTPNLTNGLKAAKNIKKFLCRIPLIKDGSQASFLKNINSNIKYSDIHFCYPTRQTVPVLNGLNLDIFLGKTVALVGPSGCGKSTIIQLLERFYDPASGKVLLDGKDIRNMTLDSLRSVIGIVSQEPNLFSKSIAENIAYGDNSRIVTKNEIIEAAKKANIHNFIASLPMGYDTKLGEKGTQLSGGQKQRIAIARALVRNPKILLLDEATSALDTESEKVVQEALDKAKVGRTCITIAHRLTTIQDADLICVINDGIVVEQGTHQELLAKHGLYYQLQTQQ